MHSTVRYSAVLDNILSLAAAIRHRMPDDVSGLPKKGKSKLIRRDCPAAPILLTMRLIANRDHHHALHNRCLCVQLLGVVKEEWNLTQSKQTESCIFSGSSASWLPSGGQLSLLKQCCNTLHKSAPNTKLNKDRRSWNIS